MSEPDKVLAAKVANAIDATRLFVSTLEAENLKVWAEHFREILNTLEAGDANEAVHALKSVRSVGPGSLSDVYPENGHFEKYWGQCTSAIENIRVFLEFGLDRPLVQLEP